jgi:GAF domain-containing protein
MDISHALGESLSEIQAQYFRDSDESDRIDWVLEEERDHLQEDLQERERFDKNSRREREQGMRSYYEDGTF